MPDQYSNLERGRCQQRLRQHEKCRRNVQDLRRLYLATSAVESPCNVNGSHRKIRAVTKRSQKDGDAVSRGDRAACAEVLDGARVAGWLRGNRLATGGTGAAGSGFLKRHFRVWLIGVTSLDYEVLESPTLRAGDRWLTFVTVNESRERTFAPSHGKRRPEYTHERVRNTQRNSRAAANVANACHDGRRSMKRSGANQVEQAKLHAPITVCKRNASKEFSCVWPGDSERRRSVS